MNTFATKETPITIMQFNTIQRTRQRLGCTSNLPSIKKIESIGDVNYKLFFFYVCGTRLSKEFDQHKNLWSFF
jgi:hypothetical protein